MSYTEILTLRKKVQKVRDVDPMQLIAARQETMDLVKLSEIAEDEFIEKVNRKAYATELDAGNTNFALDQYIAELDEILTHLAFDFIQEDNIHWDQPNIKYRTAEYNREYLPLKIFDDTKDLVRARIGLYTDWQYPGLEIGPGDAVWTKDLVAQDPLYVVDFNNEFLETTKQAFPEGYHNRLRCYLNNGKSLSMLPQGQFGFVFSWNTFNYFSFNQINNYLMEIHKVLRPGGACMFSYNNTERVNCAKRSEDRLMSFVPETILKKVVRKHGFTDIKTENLDRAISWIEFRKPGELSTPKAAQALGKIIYKFQLEA
jgi:SAM-dependent methyltransferase